MKKLLMALLMVPAIGFAACDSGVLMSDFFYALVQVDAPGALDPFAAGNDMVKSGRANEAITVELGTGKCGSKSQGGSIIDDTRYPISSTYLANQAALIGFAGKGVGNLGKLGVRGPRGLFIRDFEAANGTRFTSTEELNSNSCFLGEAGSETHYYKGCIQPAP